MRHLTSFLLTIPLIVLYACNTSKTVSSYSYAIDLKNINQGSTKVDLQFKGKLKDSSLFLFPRMVPGIYDLLNYGKYITNLQSYSKNGKRLSTQQLDANTWLIIGAKKNIHLNYTVNQGWEQYNFDHARPYVSSESHLDTTFSLLNANSLFGYFKDKNNLPFKLKLNIDKDQHISTSLPYKAGNILQAENYRHLVDNPILVSKADTASFQLPHIKVNVACYSSSGRPIAKILLDFIQPLIQNQTEYLKGQLPTDYYTFIVYHAENPNHYEGYVAEGLEHNQSTVLMIYAPMNLDILKQNVYHLASHEFFHTMLPLGLHSQEIGNFDFHSPKTSKHLWLYEGTTEYFTIHMPIWQGLITENEFMDVVNKKINSAALYNDTLPITELSKNVLEHTDQYMNVYSKGSLINLCLDILIRAQTDGKRGLKDMILDLQKIYGKNRPFEDEHLFEEIINWSQSDEIRQFIHQHIEGREPLPFSTIFSKIGWIFEEKTNTVRSNEDASPKQLQLKATWLNKKP